MKYSTKLLASASLGALMALPVTTANATIDEIVVTARKREESIQDVPLSVSAFSGDMIAKENLTDIMELTSFIAGFEFDRATTGDQERPIIRGQSNIFGESGVSYFVDGVYFDGSISTINVAEIERVEVIKGPQSALYGRNTYSGAINIITKLPGDEFNVDFSLQAAQHGQKELTASVRGPIIEGLLSGGVSLRHFEYGGEYKNQFDGMTIGDEQSESIAGTLHATPSENLDIVFRTSYSKDNDGTPATFLQRNSVNNVFGGRYFDGEVVTQPTDVDQAFTTDPGFEQERLESSLAVTWDLNDALTLTSITGFQNIERTLNLDFDHESRFGSVYDSVAIPNPVTSFPMFSMFPLGGGFEAWGFGFGIVPVFTLEDSREDEQSWSQEVRLDYDEGGRFRALGGAYYYKNARTSKDIFDPTSLNAAQEVAFDAIADPLATAACAVEPPFPMGPVTAICFSGIALNFSEDDRAWTRTETENWALFGKFDFDITEKLTVTAEGRYQEEKFDYEQYEPAVFGLTETASDTFTSFTPRFTLEYQVNDDSKVYIVAANGTKPGGVNQDAGFDSAVNQPFFDEEEIWSYEIGSKNSLFGNQLVFNVAGYYSQIKDYQLSQAVLLSTLRTSSIIQNKGDVDVWGVELDAVFTPDAVPGLVFRASYAWNDSEFQSGAADSTEGELDDFADDGLVNCSLGDLDPVTAGCQDSIETSIEGRKLPRTAEHQLTTGVDYRTALTGDVDWFVGADVSYSSSKFVQVQNLTEFGESTLVNVDFGVANENFTLSVWGKNIFDEDSVPEVTRFTEFSDFSRAYFGIQRRGSQWGATIRANF